MERTHLNPGFFDGTKSDYFHLYKEAALAVKSVDTRLRVGGPSTVTLWQINAMKENL